MVDHNLPTLIEVGLTYLKKSKAAALPASPLIAPAIHNHSLVRNQRDYEKTVSLQLS